jgi:hypothetical protein
MRQDAAHLVFVAPNAAAHPVAHAIAITSRSAI